MKKIYEMSDKETIEELFTGMTQDEVDAWVDKVYAQSHILTPEILRNGGLI